MRKLFIFLLLFFIGCTGTNVSDDEVKEANQFFESIFLDQVQDSPEFQTRLGYKSNYDQWDDITWEERKRKIRKAMSNLKYLHDNIDYDKLDEAAKISYRLIERRFERQIESNDYIFNSYPITHRGGKHSSIPSFLINYHKVDDEDDVKDYLQRLRNIEPLMDDLIKELELREDLNILAPKFVYPQAIKVSQNIIAGYPFEDVRKRNVIFNDFSRKLDKLDLSSPVKTRYLSEAEAILVTIVNSS